MSIFNRTKKTIDKLGVNEQEEIKSTSLSPEKTTSSIPKKEKKPHRGKGGSIPMSYYLPKWLIVALDEKSKNSGVSKSELVVEGLKLMIMKSRKKVMLQH